MDKKVYKAKNKILYGFAILFWTLFCMIILTVRNISIPILFLIFLLVGFTEGIYIILGVYLLIFINLIVAAVYSYYIDAKREKEYIDLYNSSDDSEKTIVNIDGVDVEMSVRESMDYYHKKIKEIDEEEFIIDLKLFIDPPKKYYNHSSSLLWLD